MKDYKKTFFREEKQNKEKKRERQRGRERERERNSYILFYNELVGGMILILGRGR